MTNLTVVQTSLDPEQGSARARRRTSIAARIGSMGQNRIDALLLLVGTLAAIIWANVSLSSYETLWETHLMVGVGDLQLNFTSCLTGPNGPVLNAAPALPKTVSYSG
jgi:hypothetical protein